MALLNFPGLQKQIQCIKGYVNTRVAEAVDAKMLTSFALLDSPEFIGTPLAPTAEPGTNTTQIANTSFVHNVLLGYIGIHSNAGFHNSFFRGKNLGSSVTTEQRAAIAAGTFDDMYIGDYWEINGIIWRIAAFDYWYNVGDTNWAVHHVVIVPDTCLYNAQMHQTSSGAYESGSVNTTEGGYIATDVYKNISQARTIIYNAFGQANVPKHRVLLPTSCTGGKYTSWAWQSEDVMLMTEVMVYGARAWGAAANNGYSVASQDSQLPLFHLSPVYRHTRQSYWLQDVTSSATFCNVYGSGSAGSGSASCSYGVRPAFPLI